MRRNVLFELPISLQGEVSGKQVWGPERLGLGLHAHLEPSEGGAFE